MIKSKYDNVELAARFIFMAERFLNLFKMYENPPVEFSETKVCAQDNLCGTAACHAGWALVALKPDAGVRADEGLYEFTDGRAELGVYLGFSGGGAFALWAYENPDLWGSKWGGCMFGMTGYRAFGRTDQDPPMTLADIAAWYLGVAERLLNAN